MMEVAIPRSTNGSRTALTCLKTRMYITVETEEGLLGLGFVHFSTVLDHGTRLLITVDKR